MPRVLRKRKAPMRSSCNVRPSSVAGGQRRISNVKHLRDQSGRSNRSRRQMDSHVFRRQRLGRGVAPADRGYSFRKGPSDNFGASDRARSFESSRWQRDSHRDSVPPCRSPPLVSPWMDSSKFVEGYAECRRCEDRWESRRYHVRQVAIKKAIGIVVEVGQNYARVLSPLNFRRPNLHVFISRSTKVGDRRFSSEATPLRVGQKIRFEVESGFQNREVARGRHLMLECLSASWDDNKTTSDNGKPTLIKLIRSDHLGRMFAGETENAEDVFISKHAFCNKDILRRFLAGRRTTFIEQDVAWPEFVMERRTLEGQVIEVTEWGDYKCENEQVERIAICLRENGPCIKGFGTIIKHLADGLLLAPTEANIIRSYGNLFYPVAMETLRPMEREKKYGLNSMYRYWACPELPNRNFKYVVYSLYGTGTNLTDNPTAMAVREKYLPYACQRFACRRLRRSRRAKSVEPLVVVSKSQSQEVPRRRRENPNVELKNANTASVDISEQTMRDLLNVNFSCSTDECSSEPLNNRIRVTSEFSGSSTSDESISSLCRISQGFLSEHGSSMNAITTRLPERDEVDSGSPYSNAEEVSSSEGERVSSVEELVAEKMSSLSLSNISVVAGNGSILNTSEQIGVFEEKLLPSGQAPDRERRMPILHNMLNADRVFSNFFRNLLE